MVRLLDLLTAGGIYAKVINRIMNVLFILFMLVLQPDSTGLPADEALMWGNEALQKENWKTASLYFEYAIDTNDLNEIGYIMAYWNVHNCQMKLNNADESASALLGFIVHTTDYIKRMERHKLIWAFSWIKKFKAERRLLYAEVLLIAYWAAKNNYSCRSKIFMCYLPRMRFLEVYKKRIPFCSSDVKIDIDGDYTTVDVICDGENEMYYFGR